MNLLEKFKKNLYKDTNLTPLFVLKYNNEIAKDNEFKQLIIDSDVSQTMVNYLKLKLLLILEHNSNYSDLNIEVILEKIGDDYKQLHYILLYSLLIQVDLENCVNKLLDRSVQNLQLDVNNKNNTLYNLQLLHSVLEVCYLRQLDLLKAYDQNDYLFNLIIDLLCTGDKDIQKKISLDIIPNYINCTNKDGLFLEIWHKIKGNLFETIILIYLEKYYFSYLLVNQFNILKEIDFWICLQNHITNTDATTKKEAMWLLNKSINIIFDANYMENNPCILEILNWENKNINEYKVAWKNFFSLCEISNEKQLHLIEPTFKLMNSVNKFLHVSWKNCITKLFIRHPHNAVVKYIIKQILNSEWCCNIDDLVTGLNHVYLYANENQSIINLLEKYIQNLNQTSLIEFLNNICISLPSPVPFYFICKSIEVFEFEEINYKILFKLLSSSNKVPHLYIRKGIQNSLFEIFLNMHKNVTFIENHLQNDCIKIISEFCEIEDLKNECKDTSRTKQLKLIIETKFKIVDYNLDEKLLSSPKHIAAFIAFSMDQGIIDINWMQKNISKFWSIIQCTNCNDLKLKYLLFLFYIEKIKIDLNKSNQILFTDDNIEKFLNELLKISISSADLHNTELFNNIVFIFDVLIHYKRKEPQFFNVFLDSLKINQKYACYIILFERIVIATKNVQYLTTTKKYLKSFNYELKDIPNKYFIKSKVNYIYYYTKLNLINLLYPTNLNIIEKNTTIIKIIDKYYCTEQNEIILLVIDTLITVITHIKLQEMDELFCSDLTNILQRLENDIFNCNEIFRAAFTTFIKLIMNSKMPNNDKVKVFIKHFCLKIFKSDQTISGLRNKILENCTTEINLETLIEALLYYPVLRKDQKIEFDTCNLITKNFEKKNIYYNEMNSYETDVRVTSLAVSTLLNMIKKMPHPNDIILKLQEKYEHCAGKRYYGDSNIHIFKLRIFQALHLIVDFLNELNCNELNTWLYNCLVNESQQPSIKILIQWLLIRIYLKIGNLSNNISNLISKSRDLTGTSITSVFPIFYHLLKDESKICENIYSLCFQFLLSFTMTSQFNIRYMAQLTLKNIYNSITKPEIKSKYSSIQEAVVNVINATDTKKAIDNVLTFEYLPVSIETIYYEIPRLTNVSHTKWIPVEYFNIHPFIKLKTSYSLKHLEPKSVTKNIESTSNEDTMNMNVQKKIDTISLNSFIEKTNKKLNNGNLIVVASLIDRAPNLGGLSRTCEIFGVKQYVLNNVQYIKNKEYLSLSMSSEKWVDTKEVKVENLSKFLIDMKKQGYIIIGAEQTANSKKLDTYEFNENTVLLLGNEKEGIPANLICLLDECIEIPQFGQIRSLNVHVAAALFIWEYSKQYS